MAEVNVAPIDDGSYRVTVTERGSSSTHEVSVRSHDLERLGSGASGRDLVAASFRFLLDREPKESIMSRFDLSVISRYFPEYPRMISDYL